MGKSKRRVKFYDHPAYIGYAKSTDDKKRRKTFEEQFNERGFDDSVTWGLDASIAKFILPRLKRYYELADKVIEIDAHKGFRKAIEEMIEGFELMVGEDTGWDMDKKKWKKVHKAWKHLGKWHNALWW